MSCDKHPNHEHTHGADCGHVAVKHGDHVDYLHDGHLHHPHGDHVDEHRLEVDEANPANCTPGHACEGHDASHTHGPGCGHEAVGVGGVVSFAGVTRRTVRRVGLVDLEAVLVDVVAVGMMQVAVCLLYTSPSPRDRQKARMPSSA